MARILGERSNAFFDAGLFPLRVLNGDVRLFVRVVIVRLQYEVFVCDEAKLTDAHSRAIAPACSGRAMREVALESPGFTRFATLRSANGRSGLLA
ncbi:MAG: hypothetical protein ABJP70_05100 [Erythrobacter sp.]